jgi:hypothetical protein
MVDAIFHVNQRKWNANQKVSSVTWMTEVFFDSWYSMFCRPRLASIGAADSDDALA